MDENDAIRARRGRGRDGALALALKPSAGVGVHPSAGVEFRGGMKGRASGGHPGLPRPPRQRALAASLACSRGGPRPDGRTLRASQEQSSPAERHRQMAAEGR